MKKLIIAAMMLAASVAFAKGSSHVPPPPPPTEVTSTGAPCWVQANEVTWLNAKTISKIYTGMIWNTKTREYDIPGVTFQFGNQTTVAAATSPAHATTVMKAFMEASEKCK